MQNTSEKIPYRSNFKGLPLSKQELEVIKLVAQGLTNREVADRIGNSWETVRGHLNSVNHKLGTKTRTGAVVKVLKSGIISLDSITLN